MWSYAEIGLALTWLIIIPYLCLFPPHRFWKLRAKLRAMRDASTIRSVTVKPKWADRKTNAVTVPPKSQATIVLVNPVSGGQLGQDLAKRFKQMLNPVQVIDVTQESPDSVFQRFQGKNVKLLVCGGDGTVGWVMNSAVAAKCCWPIGILPLGTGNDLARSIGWGGGATTESITPDQLSLLLGKVSRSKTVSVDRWKVAVTDLKTGAVKNFMMNNYVSIGIDAEIGMKFHNERKKYPERFSSQQKNVFKYALYGFEGAFEGEPLGSSISMCVGPDRDPLEVNPHWKGLVVNNLPCYHGGKDFWGTADSDEFGPVDMSDGKLEVMGLSGTLHIGLVHVSLDQALRLAQPKEVVIRSDSNICIQIDGEPFDHPPCTIEVSFAGTYPMLQAPFHISDPLVDWDDDL